MVVGRAMTHTVLPPAAVSSFATVAAWLCLSLSASFSVWMSALKPVSLHLPVCAARCIDRRGHSCGSGIHLSGRTLPAFFSFNETDGFVEGHLLIGLAKHVETDIIICKADYEGVSDHLIAI